MKDDERITIALKHNKARNTT